MRLTVSARRLLALSAAACLTAAPLLSLEATAQAQGAPAGAVGFSPPVALNDATGASTGGSEPSIEVDSKGNVYVSAPAGVPTGGCPFWEVHPESLNAQGLPYEYRGTIDTDHGSVGGGDCDISVSDNPAPGATHDVASITSLSLANLTSNKTSDGGATFEEVANSASQQVFAVDREWQAADRGLDRHYLSVHDLATVNIQVSVSIDGGYQYVQNVPAIDPATTPQALGTAVYSPNRTPSGNQFGTTVINPVTHKLYIPFIAAGPGNTGGIGHAVYLAEGDPCSLAPCEAGLPAGPIEWTNHLIFTAPTTVDLSSGFPAITIDKAGTVYVAWTGDVDKAASAGSGQDANRVFMTHSQPGNVAPAAWSTPRVVDPGTANSNVFPWLVAGDAGQVGAVWYTSVLGAQCKGVAGPSPTGVNDKCTNVWNVAYASSADADSANPTWDVVDASGRIHEGAICDQGLNCPTGTRTMLDFFDVSLDPMGRPNIAYVSDMASRNRADVQYTRQCSGTTLTGVDLPDTCSSIGEPLGCPASAKFDDPTGDAGTPNNPALDVVSSRLHTDAAAGAIHFRVLVDDLTGPTQGTAQNFIYSFTYKTKRYYVEAARSTTLTEFLVGDFTGSGGSRKEYRTIEGSFDDTHDVITMTLRHADLAPVPPLVPGDVLSTLSISSGSAIGAAGASLTPTADAAAGSCAFVVGSPTVEAVVAEVPMALALPLAAGLAFGVGVLVRRRAARAAG